MSEHECAWVLKDVMELPKVTVTIEKCSVCGEDRVGVEGPDEETIMEFWNAANNFDPDA